MRACRAVFATTIWIGSLLAMPALVLAQDSKDPHWGVIASYSPTWKAQDQLQRLLLEEAGVLKGTEFTVGFVRGSTRGGDWGVSFVKKPFEDGHFQNDQSSCPAVPSCSASSFIRDLHRVFLLGAEVHWSPTFVTINDRVQIGLNIAGGAAVVKGEVTETYFNHTVQTTPGGVQIVNPFLEQERRPAKDALFPIYPLFKLEALGSVIVAPGLKIRISGGLDFPSVSMRIAAVYLFGS